MMTTVEGVNSTLDTTPPVAQGNLSAAQKATVDYDAFLQLMIAQLENQDPTQPVDDAELMGQLASFSAVEQQIQTNEKLDALLATQTLGGASNIIGKTITSADGETTGIVKSVVLTEGGVTAELEDGTQVEMTSGTSISSG